MRNITKTMIKLYGLKEYCFMGYDLNRHATFHHIDKRENGGVEDIDNGAVINPIAHQYLHIIEYKDYQTFIAINKMLKIINMQKTSPSEEQLEIIGKLLTMFEKEHWKDKTCKGKKLIRYEYLDRDFK